MLSWAVPCLWAASSMLLGFLWNISKTKVKKKPKQNQNTKPSFLFPKSKPQRNPKILTTQRKKPTTQTSWAVLIWLLLVYFHRFFLRLLEHLCKVNSWSWVLWKGSEIAGSCCVGVNHLLQCLKQHGGTAAPISRLLWVCAKDQQCLMELLMSTLAVPACFLLVAQSSPSLNFAGCQKRRKGKEKNLSHWMCCPQGCCLLMPWDSACSHWPEIGCMCLFLEGILTFILCLR